MHKPSSKKMIVAAAMAGVLAISAVPVGASAYSGNNHRDGHWSYDNWSSKDRSVDRREARGIASDIFPNREIRSINLRTDNGVREFQVRFWDGSRVDVRARDGRVTYVDSSRPVNRNQAMRIAQSVFPRKDIRSINLRRDDGVREFQVRFSDGSRVDVRVHDGRITHVRND